MRNRGETRRCRRLAPRAGVLAGALVLVICGLALSAPVGKRARAFASTAGLTNRDVAYSPSNTAPPSIAGNAVQGQMLTEEHGLWTASPPSFSYQWEDCDTFGNNCSGIAGATAQTYVLAAGDVGHTIRVLEAATNAAGTSEPASSAQTPVVTVPEGPVNTTAPTIAGKANSGSELSASSGTWSGTTPISYAYQWQQCESSCVSIPGATSSSFTLGASDVGALVRVVVTASNAVGQVQATSSEVGPVFPTSAQIKASLLRQISPHGKGAKIASLLKHKSFAPRFTALCAGKLVIDWYYLPKGAHLASGKPRPTIIAAARASYSSAGTKRLAIKLTGTGKRRLKFVQTLKLTIKGRFVPTDNPSVSATKKARLRG